MKTTKSSRKTPPKFAQKSSDVKISKSKDSKKKSSFNIQGIKKVEKSTSINSPVLKTKSQPNFDEDFITEEEFLEGENYKHELDEELSLERELAETLAPDSNYFDNEDSEDCGYDDDGCNNDRFRQEAKRSLGFEAICNQEYGGGQNY